MEAVMETTDTGAEVVVAEPTMDQVAGGQETEITPEATPETTEVKATEEASPVPVDPPSDPAQDAVQKRINKITADKYAEKRRADDLQAKLDAQVSKPVLPADAPQLEDFDYDDGKHQEAVIQYEVRKALETQQAATNQQAVELKSQEVTNSFFDKAAKYAADHPEYDEAVKKLPTFQEDTLKTIYSQEKGPQLAHYLAEHLDIADSIASATPMNAAVIIGQISMGLTADNKTVTPSKAPVPVETLTAGGSEISKSQEDMDMEEIYNLPNKR
jgi:hypothetical protein